MEQLQVGVDFLPTRPKGESPGGALSFSFRESALHHNPEARKCIFLTLISDKNPKEIASINMKKKIILPEQNQE